MQVKLYDLLLYQVFFTIYKKPKNKKKTILHIWLVKRKAKIMLDLLDFK